MKLLHLTIPIVAIVYLMAIAYAFHDSWFAIHYTVVPDVIGVPSTSYVQKLEVDLLLRPYVNAFYEEVISRHKTIHLTVQEVKFVTWFSFTPSDERVIGCCYFSIYGPFGKLIQLKKSLLIDVPPWYLMWLVYHELGHCALGQQHGGNGGPIMEPVMPTQAPFPSEWADYVDTLFQEDIIR
jgi:hypothetical protein